MGSTFPAFLSRMPGAKNATILKQQKIKRGQPQKGTKAISIACVFCAFLRQQFFFG
jgi:hypothetical protein